MHFPGHLRDANVDTLTITKAFEPTLDRSWLVPFWRLDVAWVFISIPFGLLLTLLFYLDHNVSSLMTQARHFPVERPAGFHWVRRDLSREMAWEGTNSKQDFFLLGITTLVSGLLGLPAPNGLVPQAPAHTESLCVKKLVIIDAESKPMSSTSPQNETRAVVVRTRVVEQRISQLAMGLLTLGTMTGPLLQVLSLMPRAVFAGIFLLVGWASIEQNPILHNTIWLVREQRTVAADHPLRDVKKSQVAKFVAVQWVVFGASFGISQTLGASGSADARMLILTTRCDSCDWLPTDLHSSHSVPTLLPSVVVHGK